MQNIDYTNLFPFPSFKYFPSLFPFTFLGSSAASWIKSKTHLNYASYLSMRNKEQDVLQQYRYMHLPANPPFMLLLGLSYESTIIQAQIYMQENMLELQLNSL